MSAEKLSLVEVTPDTKWSLQGDVLPCLNLAVFGLEGALKWIDETRRALDWKSPRIFVIGPRVESLVESNKIREAISNAGGLYNEPKAGKAFSFSEMKDEIEHGARERQIKAGDRARRPKSIVKQPASGGAMEFYTRDFGPEDPSNRNR